MERESLDNGRREQTSRHRDEKKKKKRRKEKEKQQNSYRPVGEHRFIADITSSENVYILRIFGWGRERFD